MLEGFAAARLSHDRTQYVAEVIGVLLALPR
jgi:hypothetical protein